MDSGAADWLEEISIGENYLNVLLSLIHPDMHKTGATLLKYLRKEADTADIASLWNSVFSGISVMSNRKTPAHKDSNGRDTWYDLLTSFGTPERSVLEFKDIGVRLKYGPGSVVAACGQLLSHSVGDWGEGDRVCYAHFMRERVRQRYNVAAGGWVTQKMYADCLAPEFLEAKLFKC